MLSLVRGRVLRSVPPPRYTTSSFGNQSLRFSNLRSPSSSQRYTQRFTLAPSISRPVLYNPSKSVFVRHLTSSNTPQSQSSSPPTQTKSKLTAAQTQAIATGDTGDEQQYSVTQIVREITKYLVPASNDLRLRAVAAITFLVGAKLMNVQIPIYFKHIVDSLDVSLEPGMAVIVPTSMILGYG